MMQNITDANVQNPEVVHNTLDKITTMVDNVSATSPSAPIPLFQGLLEEQQKLLEQRAKSMGHWMFYSLNL